MRRLEMSLPTTEGNLALDEALLLEAEESSERGEILRLWENSCPAVVIGRSSRIREEVRLDVCQQRAIPVLRRCSGGAAVAIGPGCLMYAVVLSYEQRPWLRSLENVHGFVLQRVAEAVQRYTSNIRRDGVSDLVCGEMKFSGNSLRCKRRFLLYHGTLLYDYPLSTVSELLHMPPRQPEYRAGRAHGSFVTNLGISADDLRATLSDAWQADRLCDRWPRARVRQLVDERYRRDEWHFAR